MIDRAGRRRLVARVAAIDAGYGHLLVTAPRELHEKVAAALVNLERHLLRGFDTSLALIELPREKLEQARAADAPGRVDGARALWSARVASLAGRQALVRRARVHSTLVDAERTAGVVPDQTTFGEGLDLRVTVDVKREGSRVELAIDGAEVLVNDVRRTERRELHLPPLEDPLRERKSWDDERANPPAPTRFHVDRAPEQSVERLSFFGAAPLGRERVVWSVERGETARLLVARVVEFAPR